jgi:hypothetical protein
MNELLMCIDQIDQSVNDAEINVLESLISSYDKALMILENYEGEDLTVFDVFQEGEILDQAKGNPNESMIKRILLFIPRLLKAIWQKLTSKTVKIGNTAIDNVIQSGLGSSKISIHLKWDPMDWPEINGEWLLRQQADMLDLNDALGDSISATKASDIGYRIEKTDSYLLEQIETLEKSQTKEISKSGAEIKKQLSDIKDRYNKDVEYLKVVSKSYDEFYKVIKQKYDSPYGITWTAIGYLNMFRAISKRIEAINKYISIVSSEWNNLTQQLEEKKMEKIRT